jgi:NAD(P)H dehydrogenase (quinone)
MRLLLVVAHPLQDSYTFAVAEAARVALTANGHEIDWLDLYAEDFDPRLTASERSGYFDLPYDASAVAGHVARLEAADGLILVFPQWWFGFPAILKGWFDRVFAPGIAFDHPPAGGPITRKLTNIRLLCALTTAGSPSWVVRWVMGDPVRRLLRRGIAILCAKGAKIRVLSLHDFDRSTERQRLAHLDKVRALTARI